jgi:Holliday junction resolvase RusA-like endonuclease
MTADEGRAIDALAVMPLATVYLNGAVSFVHLGEPAPMERPRHTVTKSGRVITYTSKRSRAAVEALKQTFIATIGRRRYAAPFFPDTVAVVLVFYRVSLTHVDGDNLAKAVLDAGTKAHAWRDDSQVTHCTSVVDIDRDNPRTVVACCPCVAARTMAPLLVGA